MRFTLSEINELYSGLCVEVPNALASPDGIEENGQPISWEDLADKFPNKQYLLLDISKNRDGDGTAELIRLKRLQLRYANSYFGDTAVEMPDLCADELGININSDTSVKYEDLFRSYNGIKMYVILIKSGQGEIIDASYENRNDVVLSWNILAGRYINSSTQGDVSIIKAYISRTKLESDLQPQLYEVVKGKLIPAKLESVPNVAMVLTDLELSDDLFVTAAVPKIVYYSWSSVLAANPGKKVILCNKHRSSSGSATVDVIPIRRLDWNSITKFYPDRWVVLGNIKEDAQGNTIEADVLGEASDKSIDKVSEDIYSRAGKMQLSVERTSWPKSIPLE